jgi:hypothetical protein
MPPPLQVPVVPVSVLFSIVVPLMAGALEFVATSCPLALGLGLGPAAAVPVKARTHARAPNSRVGWRRYM